MRSITGGTMFFNPSKSLAREGATAIASSNSAVADNILNYDKDSGWISSGSAQGLEETITITLPTKTAFNRLFLLNHNFANYSVQYVGEDEGNLLEFTEDFGNAYWTKVNMTIQNNVAMSPLGTLTADRLNPSTGNNQKSFRRDNATLFEAGKIYTLSIFAKADGYNQIRLNFNSVAFGTGSTITFDTSTGTITQQSGTFLSTGMEPIGGGWFRVHCTRQATATTTDLVRFFMIDNSGNATFIGDGVSGVLVWGAKLEEGFLTPYYINDFTNVYSPIIRGYGNYVDEDNSLYVDETGASYNDGNSNGLFASYSIAEANYNHNASYYEFDEVSTDTIIIRCDRTQASSITEKFLASLILTTPIGNFSRDGVGFPNPSIDGNNRVARNINNKAIVQRGLESFSCGINAEYLFTQQDIDLFTELFDRNEDFLVWLCGGRTGKPFFRFETKPFRLVDLYRVRNIADLQNSYYKNLYNTGVSATLNLIEVEG
jgi:hypothetical protein